MTVGGTVTATVVGPVIEEHRGEAILDTVRGALEEAGESLIAFVLDLGDVSFINSSGLGVCMQLQKDAASRGAKTVIYRPSDSVFDVLRRAKMTRVFTIARTPAELTAES